MTKLNILIAISAVALAVVLMRKATARKSASQDFSQTPAVELPQRGAAVVSAAPEARRNAVADEVVRAALKADASAAPQIVAAIARSTPEVAASSAVAALMMETNQTSPITKAAVSVAPTRAQEIVNALAKAQPASFATIGTAAAEASPDSAEAVLNGLLGANATLSTLISSVNTNGSRTHYALVETLRNAEALLAKLAEFSNATPEALLAGGLTPGHTEQLPEYTALVLADGARRPLYTPGLSSPGELNTSKPAERPPQRTDSKP
jgi:hypothetical protein